MNALPILLIGGAALLMMGKGKKKTNGNGAPGGGPAPGGANPASIHCVEQGGTTDIRQDSEGNQYGACTFPDGTEVMEWAFLRGTVKPGVQVVIYSAEWCGACKSLKKDLLDAGIPFIERDIEVDDEAAGFVKGNGGAIPIATVGDEMFIGGDKLGEIQSARTRA